MANFGKCQIHSETMFYFRRSYLMELYGHIPFIFGNPWLTAFHQPGTNRSRSKGSRGCKKQTPEAGQDDEVPQSRDGWGMKCTMHTCAKNLPLEMYVDVMHILVDLFDFDFTSWWTSIFSHHVQFVQSTKIFPPGRLYPLDTEADVVATSNHQQTASLQRCEKE